MSTNMVYYVGMELDRPNEASIASDQLAESLLKAALPDYPPELRHKLEAYMDNVSLHTAKAREARAGNDFTAFEAHSEWADVLRTGYDYELKRYHRRERIRRVAKQVKGFLSIGFHKIEIDPQIGPNPH